MCFKVSLSTLKSYCWMYSSFDIPPEFEGSCARHGQDKQFGGDVFNSFYQWVSLCLVSQAVIFYFPRALWVSLEGGLMKHLAKDAGGKVVEDAEKKKDELLATFNKHLHNKYDRYFQTFIGCEVLNLVILVSQVNSEEKEKNHNPQFRCWQPMPSLGAPSSHTGRTCTCTTRLPRRRTTDLAGTILCARLSQGWFKSTPIPFSIDNNYQSNFYIQVASCSYFQYGGGGEQSRLDALCILALNIINDKVLSNRFNQK